MGAAWYVAAFAVFGGIFVYEIRETAHGELD